MPAPGITIGGFKGFGFRLNPQITAVDGGPIILTSILPPGVAFPVWYRNGPRATTNVTVENFSTAGVTRHVPFQRSLPVYLFGRTVVEAFTTSVVAALELLIGVAVSPVGHAGS